MRLNQRFPSMSRTLLVIPHYNDTKRLSPFLSELQAVLPGHFSILVSDDGSSTDQRDKLNLLIDQAKQVGNGHGAEILSALFTDKNTGKGGAVHRGWAHAEGYSVLAFADADGAVSTAEIVRAEAYFRSGECSDDALFASRVKMLGRSIQRSFLRHLSGRIFATIVSGIGNIPAYDTQCGLKLVKAESYQMIRPYSISTGFAFDVELLLLLRNFGKRIIEFPIDWHDVPGSKINLLHDSLKMTIEVIKISQRVNNINY